MQVERGFFGFLPSESKFLKVFKLHIAIDTAGGVGKQGNAAEAVGVPPEALR